jgi:hypothetical protein
MIILQNESCPKSGFTRNLPEYIYALVHLAMHFVAALIVPNLLKLKIQTSSGVPEITTSVGIHYH